MGFLEVGVPMEWKDDPEYHRVLEYVRAHGVEQFLLVWERVRDRKNDQLLWGDEIEYHLFRREGDRLVVSCRAKEVLKMLEDEDATLGEAERNVTWHPEFGAWMVEATPARPYGGFVADLRRVEVNMRHRRLRILRKLQEMGDGMGVVSMVAWPTLGTPLFWEPRAPPASSSSSSSASASTPTATLDNASSQSLFFPDSCVNPHPRFPTLVANIRKRRGRKVRIALPLFKDERTFAPGGPGTKTHAVVSGDLRTLVEQPEIYMDAMGFGMGNCCLQVTFQARDLDESRYLYDQLAILCPIFLALTAGSPVFKGLLADTDARWNVIAASVDCRTPAESGEASEPGTLPGANAPQRSHGRIRKSRYDSVDWFMSRHSSFRDEYNDVATEFDEPTLKRLLEAGVDERLARHVAHLYVRDPLVIFSDRVHVDDSATTEHFENVQSTNWQTMRWKPPPLHSSMGWRVEFRPMEVQFTDFENAAFTVVVALCARVILFFDLSLYIPLSKVDENMQRAQARDAVRTQRFFFRKNLVALETQCGPGEGGSGSAPASAASAAPAASRGPVEDEYEEMTIKDIILGKGEDFAGLVPLIMAYIDVLQMDPETRSVVDDYLDLVVSRARGTLLTPAQWIRNFVAKHPAYQRDSVIPSELARDLVEEICRLGAGEKHDETLLGAHRVVKLAEPAEMDRAEMRLKSVPVKALRGSSFLKEVGSNASAVYQCGVVRALVEKYKNRGDVSAALKDAVIADAPRAFERAKPLFTKRQKVGAGSGSGAGAAGAGAGAGAEAAGQVRDAGDAAGAAGAKTGP